MRKVGIPGRISVTAGEDKEKNIIIDSPETSEIKQIAAMGFMSAVGMVKSLCAKLAYLEIILVGVRRST